MFKSIVGVLALTTLLSLFSASAEDVRTLEIRPVEDAVLVLDDFTSANITDAEGSTGLAITLTKKGAKKMKEYSSSHVGANLALIIDGKITSIRKIKDPIVDGKLVITPYEQQEARKIEGMLAR